MLLARILRGLATYIPRAHRETLECEEGTVLARYCYAVWLRHLVMAHDQGFPTQPEVVAELGPGDSVGTGIAALLSGVTRYYALDVVRYAKTDANLRILDELVDLFEARAPIPDDTAFPKMEPRLPSYAFPSHILTEARLEEALAGARVEAVRKAIVSGGEADTDSVAVRYVAPWYDASVVEPGSTDMIISQAVLEHVDDLGQAYDQMYAWLKPGGVVSHVIDFRSHGTADEWNGHWTYSDFVWKLVRGRRTYLLNRQPHSVHLDLLRRAGFEVVRNAVQVQTSSIGREHLARRFRDVPDADLEISTAFIQAIRQRQ